MNHLEALKRAHIKGKLAHAYLLSGNDTAGKESVIQGFVAFNRGKLPVSLSPASSSSS